MSLQPEFVLIVMAAILPPLGLGVILAVRAPFAGRTIPAAVLAFFWGASVATTVALWLNDAATAALPARIGVAQAHRLVPALVGPTIEELVKAAGVLLVALVARPALRDGRVAATMGALVGLGFAAAENTSYYTLAAVQSGYPGLGRAIYLRGLVQGGNHAAFTAIVGAAVALAWHHPARSGSRIASIVGGLVTAIALHALWNALVSSTISDVLCNAPSAGSTCAAAPDLHDLLVVVPALEMAFLGPILWALTRVVRART